MPLPTAWVTVPDVGGAGDQRPGAPARADSQIGRLLRRRQPGQRRLGAHRLQDLQCPLAAVLAALQSPARSDRARLEVGPSAGHAQSLLSDPRSSPRRREPVLQRVAQTQSNTQTSMLHNLRRRV